MTKLIIIIYELIILNYYSLIMNPFGNLFGDLFGNLSGTLSGNPFRGNARHLFLKPFRESFPGILSGNLFPGILFETMLGTCWIVLGTLSGNKYC